MLTLPEDWQTWPGGNLAVKLFDQIPSRRLRIKASQHMIGATLDLMVAAWPCSRGRLRVQTLPRRTWRIADLFYVYLPRLDERPVDYCVGLARKCCVIVVVPQRCRALLDATLEALVGENGPMVDAFDSFVSQRTLFASVDMNWPRGVAELEMLRNYNRRVTEAGDGDAIIIDIPPVAG